MQRERVRAMTLRGLPGTICRFSITDQLEQTLFEVYAIIEMGTAPTLVGIQRRELTSKPTSNAETQRKQA